MNRAAKALDLGTPRGILGIYSPPPLEMNVTRWRINGFPAVVVIWTVEEWERLEERPADAQYCSNGFWCALRME